MMPMFNKKEILRQLIHFSGVLVVFIPSSWDQVMFGSVLLTVSLAGYIVAKILEEGKKSKGLKGFAVKSAHRVIGLAEREKTLTFKGAIMFFVGIGFTLIIFPRDIAFLAVVALAVGDSLSTLVGVHLGSNKIWFNRKKSWEGSLAGFAGITLVGAALGFRPDMVVITALVGTLSEIAFRKIDDNIAIPLFTGTILYALTYFGFF